MTITWKECLELIPKGTQTSSKSLEHIGGIPSTFIDHAIGCYMHTTDNKRLLDFSCGLGPIILGYNDKDINDAISSQLKKGTLFSLATEHEYNLAYKLKQIIPNCEMIRFGKNGSDAVLAAIRISSAYTKREHIARFGYNGWSDRVAITFNSGGIPPHNKNLIHEFEYNNLDSLEEILKSHEIACVVMEPVSLESPSPGYLKEVRRLATKYGALLVFDEVVTGFRFDFQGCQGLYDVDADIICFGKAISNGMPLSVVCGKKEYMRMLEKEAFYSMTFGGETLSLVSALKTLEKLEQKDYSHIWDLGNKLELGMKDLASKYDIDLTFEGLAPRHRLSFENEKDSSLMGSIFNQEMFKRGIFMPTVVYISFAHDERDIDKALYCVDEVFSVINENKNDLSSILENPLPKPIF